MCYTHWSPDSWEYDPPSPGPRPSPSIAWSLPVDIVELATSLEAFSSQLAQNSFLRLCHRFGHGPLATLPQEILDQIISHAHETMKATLRGKWKQNYLCFQSRCSRYHHIQHRQHGIQNPKMAAMMFRSIRPDEKLEELSDEECMMIPEEVTGSEDEWDYDEEVGDTHSDREGKWLDQLLNSHFGLEVIIQHEVLSSDLVSFLPYPSGYSQCSYYTSCFLGLPSAVKAEGTSIGRLATHRNDAYLKSDNHLAYNRVIQPHELGITEEQKVRFARAMRVLGLEPYYHITELESVIADNNDDETVWAICDQQISGRPKATEKARWKKRMLLNDYVRGKKEDLSKQAWPQLMLMSTSDAVTPSYA